MPTDDIFLKDIRRSPYEDVPRLIYADFLEPRGDLRHELIRVQCELPSAGGEHAQALLDRYYELIDDNKTKWEAKAWAAVKELSEQGVDVSIDRMEYDRGFIQPTFKLSPYDFVLHGEPLAAVAPLIKLNMRAFTSEYPCTDLYMLASKPALRRVHALNLSNNDLGAGEFRPVLTSPHLIHLQKLALSDNDIGDEGARILAENILLPALNTLALSDTGIGPAGITSLAGSQRFQELASLILDHNRLDDEGIETLANSPSFPKLEKFSLDNVGMTSKGLKALASSPHFPEFKELSADHNNFEDANAKTLADTRNFAHLQTLNLSECNINYKFVKALADCSDLKNLEILNLSDNHVGIRGANALMKSPYLANLRILNLRHGMVMTSGVTLSMPKQPTNLEILDLSENVINDDDLTAIAHCKNLQQLYLLNVSGSLGVGDDGVQALAESKHLEALTQLNLGNCSGITERGIEILSKWRDRRKAEGNPILIVGVDLLAPQPSPQTEAEVTEAKEQHPTQQPGITP